MNPFAAQRRGFELARAGDLNEAAAAFREALTGFARLATEEQPRALLVARAGLIRGHEERAEEVAGEFVRALPEWLRELHFESFYQALTAGDLKLAHTHWRQLVTASTLPAFAAAVNLDLLRELACQRFQVTHEDINKGVTKRAGALVRAERVLAADAGNRPAWRIVVHGYTDEIQTALARLVPAPKQNEPASALDRLTAGKRQRLQVGLRRAVRRLRRHLRRRWSRAEADVEEMVFSYRQLCHYYIGVGELETAIRLSRRARRLRPEDAELRRWARRVRRFRRRQ